MPANTTIKGAGINFTNPFDLLQIFPRIFETTNRSPRSAPCNRRDESEGMNDPGKSIFIIDLF